MLDLDENLFAAAFVLYGSKWKEMSQAFFPDITREMLRTFYRRKMKGKDLERIGWTNFLRLFIQSHDFREQVLMNRDIDVHSILREAMLKYEEERPEIILDTTEQILVALGVFLNPKV